VSLNIGGVVYDPDDMVGGTTQNPGVALAIGEAGPKGDPGHTGATGATGTRGLSGPTGPQGSTGASGATGPVGTTGQSAYEAWLAQGNTGSLSDFFNAVSSSVAQQYFLYIQGQPSAFWDIQHTLGRYCAVTVIDSAGSVVEGDVAYVSTSELTISFAAPFAGEAILT
jgi:hypothetical protein